MIAHLRGTVHRLDPPEVTVDVAGVGYLVRVPLDVWENLQEATPAMLWISTYVREDRFDLFGFPDRAGRTIFEELINIPGVGPKLGLELCAVPRGMLLQAIQEENVSILTSIKGIGKKTAEKLLLELKSLLERKPGIFGTVQPGEHTRSEFDQDAISALSTLGYDTPRIIRALKELPNDLKSTEDRVAAALRSL